ncbi:hypothetical protein GCM10007116_06180 [Sulfodiicoccus acidiphilus]|uniref:Aminopeptidase n=2 Tax=Sulfodiicoccus acidiphilus TaxID=1670455 RepID=A0A830H2P5_9CREN|nr:hypothetical protein GCM10007116_06180 [Sulfodiicoccus acidiphilus]
MEVPPGSKAEARLVREIRKLWEDWDEVRERSVPVVGWEEEEASLICEGGKLEVKSAPMSPSFEGKIAESEIRRIKLSQREIEWLRPSGLDGEIVVIGLEEGLARLPVYNCPPLGTFPCPPFPQPILFTQEKELDKLIGRCEVVVRTRLNPNATAKLVEAVRNGKSDESIYVVTHHDRWLGESDKWMEAHLSKLDAGQYRIHALSVPSRGALHPFPRSWGMEFLMRNSTVNDIKLCVDLSPELGGSYGSPGLMWIGSNSVDPYGDCFPLFRRGVPSVGPSLESLRDLIRKDVKLSFEEVKGKLRETASLLPVELKARLLNLYDVADRESTVRLFNRLHGAMQATGERAVVIPFHKVVAVNRARILRKSIYLDSGHQVNWDPNLDLRRWNVYARELVKAWTEEYLEFLEAGLKEIL